jgi:hypothetical protein
MKTLFDNYKILHGLPKPGQKIKYVRFTNAFFTNVEEDQRNLLEIGKEYTVANVQLNSSSTYVWLAEFPVDNRDRPFFNMASFEWEKPEIDLKELEGYHIHDLVHLTYSYGYGITGNGLKISDGTPVLSCEYDEMTGIVKKMTFL